MNPKVDIFLNEANMWSTEMGLLRKFALDCNLIEELKWRQPCYTFQNKNIVIIGGFKDYCALMFFKGALLNDSSRILISPGQNTQSSRQIRFTSTQEVNKMEAVLKAYIFEAIEVEKAGLKVKFKETEAYKIPIEFQEILDENLDLKTAFETLTPGRQKAYLLHFSEPKQAKTRTSRIKKHMQRILSGKGLNDCICGLSKRFPQCDGSHKNI